MSEPIDIITIPINKPVDPDYHETRRRRALAQVYRLLAGLSDSAPVVKNDNPQ